ncbi:MAG TPA: T9SS type A sorting domain-containing protein [Bacteroidia bacterium]|jgi:hypothetical protein
MKKTITLLAFLSAYAFMNAQTFDWAKKFSLSNYTLGTSIELDAAGNIYVSGSYYETGSAGPPSGPSGAYIAKFDNSGNLQWRDTVNGSDGEWQRVAVDPSGNVYLGTFVTGTKMVGGTAVTSAGVKDMLISKYDPSGTLLWVKTAGGTANDVIQGIDTDAAGNIYITGYFGGTALFDGISLSASGNADIFVAKLNPAGAFLWAEKATGASDVGSGVGLDQALNISVDNAGNSYIAGYFVSSAVFGTITITGANVRDGYIAKINTGGTWDWATTIAGTTGSIATAMSIATDITGNSYVAGSFSGTTNFNGATLTSLGSNDAYLAKFNNSGAFVWARQAGGTGNDLGHAVMVDALGNPYLAGSFTANATVGDTSFTIAGEENAFIAKYDNAGTFSWAKQIKANTGAWEFVTPHGMDTDAAGNVYVTGVFFAGAIFDGITLTATLAAADAFIAKLNPSVATNINAVAETAAQFQIADGGNQTLQLLYKTEQPSIVDLEILSVTGQCIYMERNIQLEGKGSKSIALPACSKGMYFVNLISKENKKALKMVIH